MKALKPILISGKEVLPLIEGGKGVAVTNGASSGAWANAGGVGTFSSVTPDNYDENGNYVPLELKSKIRTERHEEFVKASIEGGIAQAKIAYEKSNGEGRVHMNMLWELGSSRQIVKGIMEGAKGLVHGVTSGAGMPFALPEVTVPYGAYYYPIVSSARAFKLLWKRSFCNHSEFLGGVVYEDPWLAGGHNGLSNSEDPKAPQDPYPRLVELRKAMNEVGLNNTPVVMAGGVWYLRDWEHMLDNSEVGPIAFQFGTRPLLTQESPVGVKWRDRLFSLKEGDVSLQNFSPTGFYSSAVRNDFIKELESRLDRQIDFSQEQTEEFSFEYATKGAGTVYIKAQDAEKAEKFVQAGFEYVMKTPDNTLVFFTKERQKDVKTKMAECRGCLSHCRFSGWMDKEPFTTGRTADPRSFCIHNTLMAVAHDGNIENELMFAGHQAFNFAKDPFYQGGKFVPTVKQLVERIQTGD